MLNNMGTSLSLWGDETDRRERVDRSLLRDQEQSRPCRYRVQVQVNFLESSCNASLMLPSSAVI